MRFILVLFVLFCAVTSIRGMPELLGPGRWCVQNIQQCENAEQYELTFEMSRKKLNRTHDCFSLSMKYEKPFTELYGIELEVFKEVDGGFKYYQSLQDPSACHFAQQYAEENFIKMLNLAGVDPPACPIPPGDHKVEEFVFNYSELTDPYLYGKYEINCYLLFAGERVSCVKVFTNYERNDDNDDDDDDD